MSLVIQTSQNNLDFSLCTVLFIFTWSQLQRMKQSPKKMSADDGMLLLNTKN